ncbi:kinetochore-associated Ndc80 complex subunit nuf2 [Zygosaccharomyces mellis]|uniref:Kinetochore-associated Ndc80 complex subunit nuf2 n=1 Tax=Zygosaccharomyces mellis TaxID=42258 RepID=A0A4C2DYZ4_9SACH|nr:kinetochore-associated Ndc80 complex subunit nuf2 [Zygosaccharomyces mellis]
MNNDIFPLLDIPELSICLQSCDFSLATEDNIARPTSMYVMTLYKQIIDNFMGISADSLINIGREDDEEDDAAYNATLQVLVLNKICFKFFENIGVNDFNMLDLYRPDALRTRRLLSAVVNYARFREERMFDCNRFISQTEALLGQLRSKFDDYNLLQQQLEDYDEEATHVGGPELESLEDNNKELEAQLRNLTQIQQTLSSDYNKYKDEKQKMLKELESFGFQVVELESLKEKLSKFSDTNLQALQDGISELQTMLGDKQRNLTELQKSQKNFEVSTQTFQRIIEELYELLRIISTELQESHMKESNLMDLKQQLIIRREKMETMLSSGLMVKMSVLQEQLDIHRTQLDDLERNARLESKRYDQELSELQQEYADNVVPQVQQAEQNIERDFILGQVKQLEQKMQNIKVDFQNEVDAVELEYSLLAGHINRYMETMLDKL